MDNEIHPAIWHACSGIFSLKPILSSMVYYFPQGHIDTYSSAASIHELCAHFPPTKSQVLSMKLLADPETDEVFALMHLKPILPQEPEVESSRSVESFTNYIKAASYKRLEITDIESGICSLAQCLGVNGIFNKENTEVSLFDIHNNEWTFHHMYDNIHGVHSLTSRWPVFVASKNLEVGDFLILLKSIDDRVTVGVRRSNVANPNEDAAGFFYNIRNIAGEHHVGRIGNGLCSVEALGKAVSNAFKKDRFEAVYYPMAGKSSFVYDSNAVDNFLRTPWVTGMRVRKNIVGNQLSRLTIYGFITYVCPDRSSPWKHLKVMWDDAAAEQEENCWEISPVIPTVPNQKRKFKETEELTLFGERILVQRDKMLKM